MPGERSSLVEPGGYVSAADRCTVDEARAYARSRGVAAALLIGVRHAEREIRVTVPSDAADLVSVSMRTVGVRASVSWTPLDVSARDEGAPDETDCYVTVPFLEPRLLVRFSAEGGSTADVEVSSAALALVHAHGWRDDLDFATATAELVVPTREVLMAVARVRGESGTATSA